MGMEVEEQAEQEAQLQRKLDRHQDAMDRAEAGTMSHEEAEELGVDLDYDELDYTPDNLADTDLGDGLDDDPDRWELRRSFMKHRGNF